MAINQPGCLLSLPSMMGGSGGSYEATPTPECAAVLVVPPPATREERIELAMTIHRTLAGAGDQLDEAVERARAERSVDRAYYPLGVGRQLVAIMAAGSRLERLKLVRVPTLVVHGTDDVLVPVDNGRLVAGAVPGARFLDPQSIAPHLPARSCSDLPHPTYH